MSSKHIFLIVVLAYYAEFWPITTGVSDTDDTFTGPEPNPYVLRVYALPVGQGDCTIIQCPGHVQDNVLLGNEIIMVDCGSSSGKGNRFEANDVRGFLGKRYVENSEVTIFITHGDADHYNYLYKVFTDNYVERIKKVYIGGSVDDYKSKKYPIYNWLRSIADKVTDINDGNPCIGSNDLNSCGPTLKLCSIAKNVHFDILAANHRDCNCKNTNPKSIVMKVSVHTLKGSKSILLPGDMEGEAANNIAKDLGNSLQSTVYKLAHHGASTDANPYYWLRFISPEMAFASSAFPGSTRYHHPRCDAIARLQFLFTMQVLPDYNHEFSCGTKYDADGGYIYKPNYGHNIYATTPTMKEHCELNYYFSISQPSVLMEQVCHPAIPNTVSSILGEQDEYESCDADGDYKECIVNDDQ